MGVLLAAVGAPGCGDDSRATTPRADVPQASLDLGNGGADAGPVDTGSVGVDTPTASDTPGLDAAAADTGPAGSDVVSVDAGPDVQRPALQRLCGFSERQINALAVRLATCLRRPAQEVLNELWRPDSWEAGPIARRSCPALAECAANTNTGCSGIMGDCLKYVVNPADMGVCPTPAQSCGAGDRFAQSCANGLTIADDCPATGRRCVASSTEAVCAQQNAATCAPGSPPRCEGDVLQECRVGLYVAVRDCSVTGGTCNATAGGCMGTGDPCTGDAVDCDGTRLRRCLNGRYQSYDCGALVRGATCQRRGSAVFCGTGTDCDPSMAPANGACEGNNLTTCAAGRSLSFDCTSAGFRACSPTGCTP
ncbi:MAG: hypothetical protein JNK72_11375 [Myxococcales bacterium]|nr:hypothetical protein [Myxococcales bacterium]